ncbi:MAG: HDOD domain-containing protein [Pseudomonadota bacterium]
MKEVFIGRQPIYDHRLNVYAYELLYRDGASQSAKIADQARATSQVVLNSLMEIGLEQLIGEHLAFINFDEKGLLSTLPNQLPKDKVVLEVLEHVPVTPSVLAALKALTTAGYTVALDDFIYHERLQPMVTYASIIKIDIQQLDRAAVSGHVARLKRPGVKLLAEKVETQEDVEYCRKLGFDYYQGYFLSRPHIVRGKGMPSNRLSILRLLSRLQDPEITLDELTALVSQDVTLSYRLLRYINSANFALSRKVESIQNAIMMLGLNHVKQLVSLVAMTQLDGKPPELIRIALVRAKMCETLARSAACADSSRSFTVGLFSTLPNLLEQPMNEILPHLPLVQDITLALLKQAGEPGKVLKCVLAYEKCDWNQVAYAGLKNSVIRACYLESVLWAEENFKALMHQQ